MRRRNVSYHTLAGRTAWRLIFAAVVATMLVCCASGGEPGHNTPGPTYTPSPASTKSASKTAIPTTAIASSTATTMSVAKRDSPRFELQGVTELEMTVLLDKFRHAIEERDMTWLSQQIAYPIRVWVNDKFLVIGSAYEFVRHYDQIINPTLSEMVLGAEVSDLFVNSKGILIGGREYLMGAIWLAYRCTSSSCDTDTRNCPLHIISIHNASRDASAEVPYIPIPTPTPPALNPSPDLVGLWDVAKINLPGSMFNDCSDVQKETENIAAAQLRIHRDGRMQFLDATCDPVNREYKVWSTDTFYRFLSGTGGDASPFLDGVREPYVQVMHVHCQGQPEDWHNYSLIYQNPTSIVFLWEKYHLVMSKNVNNSFLPPTPTAAPDAVFCDPGPFAECHRANLAGADLSFADLREADLRSANVYGANLRGALLDYASLTDAELSYADLRGASLRGATLGSADLSYADLRLSDLSDVELAYANLSGADLRDADLSYADLHGASFRGTNLRMSNLSLTDLSGVDLYGAYYNVDTKWPEGFDPVGAGASLKVWSHEIINGDQAELVTLSSGGLTSVVTTRIEPWSNERVLKGPILLMKRPILRIWVSDQGTEAFDTQEPVLEYDGKWAGPGRPWWLLELVELDDANDGPEVLFSESSGGNACCASTIVFSQDSAGIWQTIDVGEFYTPLPFGAEALPGSDGYVMTTIDGRFARFGECGACWRAPRLIFAIESGQVVDVSARPSFAPLFREDARRLKEEMVDLESGHWGFWAAYMATKARAGEFDEAWEEMLASTEFPSSAPGFVAFLKEAGYIIPDKVFY